VQRLLDNTPSAHRDYEQLQQAERTIHKLAVKINSVKESKHEEDLQETLKKLELLLITDVFTTCLIICLLLLLLGKLFIPIVPLFTKQRNW